MILQWQMENTCIVDEDVQVSLAVPDVFGQVSDGLQRVQVQLLHHHIAVATFLSDLIGGEAGSGHVPAGEDHSGPLTKNKNNSVHVKIELVIVELVLKHWSGHQSI